MMLYHHQHYLVRQNLKSMILLLLLSSIVVIVIVVVTDYCNVNSRQKLVIRYLLILPEAGLKYKYTYHLCY